MKFFIKSKFLRLGLTIFTLVALVTAGIFVFNRKVVDSYEPGKDTVTQTVDVPSEKPVVKNVYNWQGGATDPKYIALPTIGAEGFIEKMGVDQNKQMAAPTNINVAGWYIDSVKPGDDGLSIIDGHINGHSQPGIFVKLQNLTKGDKYSVTFGDGRVKQFEVLSVNSVDEQKSASVLFSQNPEVKSQLNLITCGGKFDSASHSYLQRVIVSSKAI